MSIHVEYEKYLRSVMKELFEKDTPMKPRLEQLITQNNIYIDDVKYCNNCNGHLFNAPNYCEHCGQKLDCSNENE